MRVGAVAYGFELRRAELERQVRRIRRQYVTELRTLGLDPLGVMGPG